MLLNSIKVRTYYHIILYNRFTVWQAYTFFFFLPFRWIRTQFPPTPPPAWQLTKFLKMIGVVVIQFIRRKEKTTLGLGTIISTDSNLARFGLLWERGMSCCMSLVVWLKS